MKLVSQGKMYALTGVVMFVGLLLVIRGGDLWRQGDYDVVLLVPLMVYLTHLADKWNAPHMRDNDNMFSHINSSCCGIDGREITREMVIELQEQAKLTGSMDWQWAMEKQAETGYPGALLVDRVRVLRRELVNRQGY